jgi:hypothetical protein
MNPVLDSALKNWKSTVQSILTVTLFTTATLLTLPSVQAYPKLITGLSIAQVLAKLWIGLISHDAKPSATSSVTIESTAPIEVPPIQVQQAKETK